MVRTTTAARPSDLCPSARHSPMGELTGFHLSAPIAFNCSEVLEPRRLEMATTTHISVKRTIRRQQLREIVPLADSTIYEMEQRGEFPRRFALSPRCVVWDLAEVEAWLAARRSAPIARAISRCQAAAIAPGSIAGSGSSSGIEGGMSTGTRFLPATQASMMSDHSCIIWRRCTSYSALL